MPLPILMAVRNIPWRLIVIGAAVLAVLSAGIWFRGVLADRAELKAQNVAQAAELTKEREEVKRMNMQKELDAALFEQVEQQKAIQAAELKAQTANIRKLRSSLDAATTSCFNVTLPDNYLDGLPKSGN